MSCFISVRVKKLMDTKHAKVTPYCMASSVKEGNGSGTRKFWTTTPTVYASNKMRAPSSLDIIAHA